jgi:hypothetical protein
VRLWLTTRMGEWAEWEKVEVDMMRLVYCWHPGRCTLNSDNAIRLHDLPTTKRTD